MGVARTSLPSLRQDSVCAKQLRLLYIMIEFVIFRLCHSFRAALPKTLSRGHARNYETLLGVSVVLPAVTDYGRLIKSATRYELSDIELLKEDGFQMSPTEVAKMKGITMYQRQTEVPHLPLLD